MTKTIASRQNVWFKRIRDAAQEHASEIVLEGPKMVVDAIAAGWRPIAVVRRSQVAGRGPVSAATGDRQPATLIFTHSVFDAVSDTKTSQGILALFERPPERDVFARRDTVVVALDRVQDPGNVGTIIRLAAAFDAAGVALLPGCADPFSPKAIRASAGAILTVPVAEVSIAALVRHKLFAADSRGKAIDPPARDAVLIFGSEGEGVSEELRKKSVGIAIPMSDRVESLNVAAAAAILLSRSFSLRIS